MPTARCQALRRRGCRLPEPEEPWSRVSFGKAALPHGRDSWARRRRWGRVEPAEGAPGASRAHLKGEYLPPRLLCLSCAPPFTH